MLTQTRRNALGKLVTFTIDGLTVTFNGHTTTLQDEFHLWHYLDVMGELVSEEHAHV